MNNKSFSDRLTPGQIQQVFDALSLPWRDFYNPDNGGWVNIETSSLEAPGYYFESDLSVNILHGGWVDQYMAGHPDPMIDDMPIRGDIVTLVMYLKFRPSEGQKAIKWIKRVLGMGNGVKPPELADGRKFAKDFKDSGGGKFLRLPKDLARSNLTTSEKLVWAAIFDRCGKDDSGKEKIYSYPGFRKLSEDTGLAVGTVQKAVSNLICYGLLIERPRGTGKAPARFPLIASEDKINSYISNTVSNIEHPRSLISTPTVSNSELNYTDRHNKLDSNSYKGKSGDLPRDCVSFVSEKQGETYLTLLANVLNRKVPEPPTPPAAYSQAFRATFNDAHTLSGVGYPWTEIGRITPNLP